MLNPFALILRRHAPDSMGSVDLSGEIAATRRQIDGLTTSVATLQQQCQDILKELRATNGRLDKLTLRESQLRAVLKRDAELDTEEARLDAELARGNIAGHIAAAIEGAELHRHPFPYAIVDDLLPRGLYKR